MLYTKCWNSEFIVKTFANTRPETYLEWGTGMLTSFDPLLVSGDVYAIDRYPPWCEQVAQEPRVQCTMQMEKRFHFSCSELTGADGVSKFELFATGRLLRDASVSDVEAAMSAYVNAIEKHEIEQPLDMALVDGRFRVQCAIKFLPYLHQDSVLLLHDFWIREPYHVVLDYYDVIRYARSVVALKKKVGKLSAEQERSEFTKFMKYESIPWVEF
ncbi:hypothetical protein ACHAW6_005030 [Cyclotella cf. meneghiniana]